MPARKVSLVVVNYNSARLTGNLLDAVDEGADEIVIVDNSSPDGGHGLDAVTAAHPEATLIRLPTNGGYGAGLNEGARHVSGDVLVVSNPDVTISGDDLRALAEEVGRDDVVLAAPRFVNPDGSLERSAHRREPRFLTTLDSYCGPFAHLMRRWWPDWHATFFSPAQHLNDVDSVHVLGALMAIDRAAFNAVGGFDEGFFMYREETDLCRRLRRRGGRIRHVGHLTAEHIGGASTQAAWAYQGSAASLESHYRYIAKHWGRLVAVAARALGIVSATVWLIAGPPHKRPLARRALRWHVGLPMDR